MSSITEKKKLKQARILDAAYKLFCDKTFNSTAIDDVVRCAGVAKGTFYLYFKDKYDLLDQIIILKTSKVITDAHDKLIAENSRREMSFPEQTLFFIDSIIDYMQENRKLTALIDKNLAACFRSLIKIESDEFRAVIDDFVEMYMRRGYTEDEAQKALYMLTDMIGSICCDAVLGNSLYSMSELRPTIHKMITKLLA